MYEREFLWGGRRAIVMTYRLSDLVEIEELQGIQERFATAIGFGVIIADERGTPITQPSQFTSFCQKMRSSEEGLRCCMLSDQQLGKKAAAYRKPVVHHCHAGLTDLAAPIILHDQHIGSVLCGQVFVPPQSKKQLAYVKTQLKQLSIDDELLTLYLEEVSCANEKQIESALHILQIIADYIVKISANALVEQQNGQLMQRISQQEELKTLVEDMQLQVLQMQFNPHFLFNTLNTISRIAYLENAEQTEQVTYALAKIMRYSLRNPAEPVTLKEELAYIDSYLTIQQSRFRHQIVYKQHIDVDPRNVTLPILSIQPFIENAIMHGLAPQIGEKKLTLRVFTKARQLVIEVSDSGIGMSAERIQTIFSRINAASYDTTNIGMNNVHKRLQYCFGAGYGIHRIESELNVGTTIQIILPMKEAMRVEANDCR